MTDVWLTWVDRRSSWLLTIVNIKAPATAMARSSSTSSAALQRPGSAGIVRATRF